MKNHSNNGGEQLSLFENDNLTQEKNSNLKELTSSSNPSPEFSSTNVLSFEVARKARDSVSATNTTKRILDLLAL